MSRFAKYAWFVLFYNLLVVLWGVFLRASKSGDGCGQHWLTCHGEVLPSAPEFKTVIEFTHRIMSALDGLIMVILLVWAVRIWLRSRDTNSLSVLRTTAASFFFVLTEGALGAGLVLTGNTAETLTAARPFWMAAHLVNTFILLAFLTLTARRASGADGIRLRDRSNYLAAVAAGILLILIVSITGSIAALANMIFPSGTLAEGIAKDFSATSHMLLRLRLLHPITAVLTSVFLVFLTSWMGKASGSEKAVWWANATAILVLVQIGFGSATLLMLAPIVMQLGHLLIADMVWISFVMLAAAVLSAQTGEAAESTSIRPGEETEPTRLPA
jgi:heme A synthase